MTDAQLVDCLVSLLAATAVTLPWAIGISRINRKTRRQAPAWPVPVVIRPR